MGNKSICYSLGGLWQMTKFLKKLPPYAVIMISAGIYGIIAFIAIYGVKILNPTYDDWLFTGGDLTQHYIGWLFYRRSEWHIPFGLVDGLLGDISFSCMYTDSIPLLAVFFKILSPILPETFQYFGLWGLLCFVLNGSTSSLLIYKFNKNPIFCLLGSLIYILCPAILHRLYGHEALAGHFIIILAMILWVYQNHVWKKDWMNTWMPAILWGALGIIAVYTHMYYLPMIYCFLLAAVIIDVFKYKKVFRPLSCFAFMTISALVALAAIGAFYGESSQAAYGLGLTSANLNTFWNGMEVGANGIFAGEAAKGSCILSDVPYNHWQFEGFAYLGLGVLLAVSVCIIICFAKIEKKDKDFFIAFQSTVVKYKWHLITFVTVFAISMFFAVSPTCTLNDKIVYTIEYPQSITEFLGIFRASGRFAWVADYLIFTAVLFIFSKINGKKTMIFALSVCLCLQFADLSELLKSKNWFKEPKTYTSILQDPKWNELAAGAENIVILPYDVPANINYTLAKFAYDHNMTINHFSVARPPIDLIIQNYHENIERIAQGNGDPLTLYVFLDKQFIPADAPNIDLYDIDGLTVVKCN